MFNDLIDKIRDKWGAEDKQLDLAVINQELIFQGSEVTLKVFGHVQEERAQIMIPSLVQFFREEGKVMDISFKLEVREEEDKSQRKAYTNSEKFELLKQKHGALAELQRKFGLETDF